jgi:hypothetical protein
MGVADEPQVGQIVDHYFLWFDEQAAGRTEGRKSRPCLIIAIEPRKNAAPRVTVLPITSQAPRPGTTALAVPGDVKDRIGLSRTRPAWIIIDDANIFAWPGYDLVPQPGGRFVRAVVTRGFFHLVRNAVSAAHTRNRPRRVERDE